MSKQVREAYIVAAKRTPVGKGHGVFSKTRPDDLLVTALKALLAELPSIDQAKIDDVLIGCAMPEAEQGMNVARIAALMAGLPDSVPGMTINRFCSSGLQTISMAADQIALGHADLIIAGGCESMSMVPLGGNQLSANPAWFSQDNAHIDIAYSMGITAEKVAEKWGIDRVAQDTFALESHRRALVAIERGDFTAEIAPVTVYTKKANRHTGKIDISSIEVNQDQGPRANSSIEALAKLRGAFFVKGSVTAGNASQISDGAAALLVASEEALKQYNLTPMAKFKSFRVAGVAPEYMGIGPVAAIPKALAAADLSIEDMDWIELNEAFAAQTLAVIQDLKLDKNKVNPLGGAIALGHPLGATGAIRTTTLLHAMQREQLKYGMVTMCIGTGMGAAGIFERI